MTINYLNIRIKFSKTGNEVQVAVEQGKHIHGVYILCSNVTLIIDKMFNLTEIMREGSLQTGNKEEMFMLMPVPDAHFSKLMAR